MCPPMHVPSSRMKILHLITSLDTGGAERMLAKLVTGMPSSRYENVVVCMLSPGPVAEEIRSAGVDVQSLGLSRGIPHPRAMMRLVRIMRTFRPALVQTWLYHADLLGLLASFGAGRPPVIWNIRNTDLELVSSNKMTAAVLRVNGLLSRFPAAVIANSRVAATFHTQAGYRPKRWEVLPNGFDTGLYSPDAVARNDLRRELGLPENALLVGHCARFDPVKDHDMFLRAARGVAASFAQAHFVLCGDGVRAGSDAASIFSTAANDPILAGRIHLLGRRGDVHRVMAGLDLFCLSSRSEGFPNVLGEAMSCAVPCVATDVGDCRDILSTTGRIVPSGDWQALADALTALLKLPEQEREHMGELARQRIESRYSLSAVVSNYLELYEMIVGF